VTGIDWARWSADIAQVQQLLDERGTKVVAPLDQQRAWVRDMFDEVGLTLTDPTVVASALMTIEWINRKVEIATRSGDICPASTMAIAGIQRGLIAGLLPYLPAEATR